jgi:hypothetical protein
MIFSTSKKYIKLLLRLESEHISYYLIDFLVIFVFALNSKRNSLPSKLMLISINNYRFFHLVLEKNEMHWIKYFKIFKYCFIIQKKER